MVLKQKPESTSTPGSKLAFGFEPTSSTLLGGTRTCSSTLGGGFWGSFICPGWFNLRGGGLEGTIGTGNPSSLLSRGGGREGAVGSVFSSSALATGRGGAPVSATRVLGRGGGSDR